MARGRGADIDKPRVTDIFSCLSVYVVLGCNGANWPKELD